MWLHRSHLCDQVLHCGEQIIPEWIFFNISQFSCKGSPLSFSDQTLQSAKFRLDSKEWWDSYKSDWLKSFWLLRCISFIPVCCSQLPCLVCWNFKEMIHSWCRRPPLIWSNQLSIAKYCQVASAYMLWCVVKVLVNVEQSAIKAIKVLPSIAK